MVRGEHEGESEEGGACWLARERTEGRGESVEGLRANAPWGGAQAWGDLCFHRGRGVPPLP